MDTVNIGYMLQLALVEIAGASVRLTVMILRSDLSIGRLHLPWKKKSMVEGVVDSFITSI